MTGCNMVSAFLQRLIPCYAEEVVLVITMIRADKNQRQVTYASPPG